jgi:hypothetical protein
MKEYKILDTGYWILVTGYWLLAAILHQVSGIWLPEPSIQPQIGQ